MVKSMSEKITYYILVLFLTSLCSCEFENDAKFDIARNIYKDENKPQKVEVRLMKYTLKTDSCSTVDSIVVLDTTANIGHIDKVQVRGNRIYIMDKSKAKAVFCYTFDGKLMWKYNKHGLGRGKFAELGDIHVQNDRVYALDVVGLKIIQLDTFGLFVKETKLGKNRSFFPDQLFVDPNSSNVILYNFDMGDYDLFPWEMTVMDPACKKMLSCHLSKTHDPAVKRWDTDVSPLQYFSDNKGFYFTRVLNDTIYSYRDSTFSRKYVIDFGKDRIPEQIKQKKKFRMRNFQATNYEGNIQRIVEDDSLVSFMFSKGRNPAYTFFDKHTLQSKSFEMVFFNINKYNQMLLPIGNWNGKMIISLSPAELVRYFSFYRKLNPGLTDEQLESKMQNEMPLMYRLKKKVTMRSNPMLVFISFSRSKLFPNEKI